MGAGALPCRGGLGERQRLPIGAEQARFRMSHHLPEGCIGTAQCFSCQDRRDTTTHILRLAFENKGIVLKPTLATHPEYDWNERVRTAEIFFLFSLLQDTATKKPDGGALSLATLRVSTAHCGSAFTCGPARPPLRDYQQLLRALPSRQQGKWNRPGRYPQPSALRLCRQGDPPPPRPPLLVATPVSATARRSGAAFRFADLQTRGSET